MDVACCLLASLFVGASIQAREYLGLMFVTDDIGHYIRMTLYVRTYVQYVLL